MREKTKQNKYLILNRRTNKQMIRPPKKLPPNVNMKNGKIQLNVMFRVAVVLKIKYVVQKIHDVKLIAGKYRVWLENSVEIKVNTSSPKFNSI